MPTYDPWVMCFRLALAYTSPFLVAWLALMPLKETIPNAPGIQCAGQLHPSKRHEGSL